MPTSPIAQLLIAFVVSGVLLAAWKGGKAERLAAVVVAANMILGLATSQLAPDFEGMVRFANDGLAAVALLAVTLIYGAPWMGGVMLLFAAQFSMHSYYLVMARESDYVYALINNINFSGIIWCLIIGTVVSWRRRIHLARAAQSSAA